NPSCRGAVERCAAKSTCGKPGFVTCCRTSALGKTRCSVKKDAAHCTASHGTVGTCTSCCDACSAPSGPSCPRCGPSVGLTCGGTCGSGQVCSFSWTDGCVCVSGTVACSPSTQVCTAGACPTGQVCSSLLDSYCVCFSGNVPCGGTDVCPADGACGGYV